MPHAPELELFHPQRTALIVIDLQNDYCDPEGHFARTGRAGDGAAAAIDRIAELLPVASSVGVPVVFTRNVYDQPFMSRAILDRRRLRGQSEEFCIDGTWGAEFHRVSPGPDDYVVTKHRYGSFTGTNLGTILRSRGVDSLVLCGVKTNVCVETTAREGYMLDHNVLVLSDSTATDSDDLQASTLENMRRYFGYVASTADISSYWQQTQIRAVETQTSIT